MKRKSLGILGLAFGCLSVDALADSASLVVNDLSIQITGANSVIHGEPPLALYASNLPTGLNTHFAFGAPNFGDLSVGTSGAGYEALASLSGDVSAATGDISLVAQSEIANSSEVAALKLAGSLHQSGGFTLSPGSQLTISGIVTESWNVSPDSQGAEIDFIMDLNAEGDCPRGVGSCLEIRGGDGPDGPSTTGSITRAFSETYANTTSGYLFGSIYSSAIAELATGADPLSAVPEASSTWSMLAGLGAMSVGWISRKRMRDA